MSEYVQQTSTSSGNKGVFLGGCLCGCCVAIILPFILLFLSIASCGSLISKTSKQNLITDINTNANVIREGSGDKKIAVINISGVIGHYPASVFSDNTPGDAGRILKEIRQVAKDSSYGALLLDMNTPGGEVVAGDEIRSAIDELEIPVVTCMHSMGASGGYYIASGSDWIVANAMTLTGSIGVIM
ncbi:MAG: S49 family peptidase, partial [Lentisphaeria bacterium]|nr:S49 family peptidase [Lentisphaeria bacterium]